MSRSGSDPLPMRPAGLRGRLFGQVMERMNAASYRRAVELLAPRSGQAFLEIGFGTGRLLELLLASAPEVCVAGVDPTATMLEVASGRPGIARHPGRVDLRQAYDFPLPWEAGAFDGIAALHSFQFWPDPARTVGEILRVLRPGGRLVLVLRDHTRRRPAWLPNPISRSADEVAGTRDLLRRCGLREVEEEAPVGTSRVLRARAPGS